MLEPLHGYLILALKLYKQPKKYSGPWNFGAERNTITSVEQVIHKIIFYWGEGKYKKINKKKFYEQTNLQLNITKAKKELKWKPKLSIDDCVSMTVDWYRKVLTNRKTVQQITKSQILKNIKLNEKKN